VRGRVEVMWQGGTIPGGIRALGGECHLTGEMARTVVNEDQLNAAIDALRRANLKLISVTPVRATLEDYFVQKLSPVEAVAR
jgi:hypothetical protein